MKRWLLVAVSLACSVQADLIFDGYVRLEGQIRQAYQRFPERGKEVPITFKQVKRLEKNQYAGWYDHHGHAYVKGTAGLAIWIHEYGHHYWTFGLTEAERAAWSGWWRKNRRVTSYSRYREDAEEGFAVSFQYFYAGQAMKDYWRRKTREFLE